jgi:hypothetical protein
MSGVTFLGWTIIPPTSSIHISSLKPPGPHSSKIANHLILSYLILLIGTTTLMELSQFDSIYHTHIIMATHRFRLWWRGIAAPMGGTARRKSGRCSSASRLSHGACTSRPPVALWMNGATEFFRLFGWRREGVDRGLSSDHGVWSTAYALFAVHKRN